MQIPSRVARQVHHWAHLFILPFLIIVTQSLLAQSSIFTIQNSPSPDTQGNTLNAVAALSTTDVWAVGYKHDNNLNDSRTLTLHWDGADWSIAPSPGDLTADEHADDEGHVEL